MATRCARSRPGRSRRAMWWITGDDALSRLAWHRVWGRPFTVSEYNHPAPNEYEVECIPLLATIAALQDRDGVYVYSYQHGDGSWKAERIQSFFDVNGNPAKLALLPTAAALFRRVDVSPLREERTTHAPDAAPRTAAVHHRLGCRLGGAAEDGEDDARGADGFQSHTVEVVWEAENPDHARFSVNASRAKVLLGYIAEERLQLDELTVETGATGLGLGAISLISLDGEPIPASRRMLLTTLARAQNTGMEWNGSRTSVSDRWGRAPVLMEIVPAKVRIASRGAAPDVWSVFPLDGTGQRRAAVASRATPEGVEFVASPRDGTVWYEIVLVRGSAQGG